MAPADPPDGTAEPRSHDGGTSGRTYSRKAKVCKEKSVRKSPADTKVKEVGGGSAPHTGAEIPIQPTEKTMGKQLVTLQHTEEHVGEDIHTTACGGHHARADGCALNELQTVEKPCRSGFILKDCSPWKDPGWSKGEAEEGATEMKCYELDRNPYSPSPCMAWCVGRRK
ncbi:hypothetical protein llap_10146 [Limosa lapponica baueri]|uniref:Uncharacterized protein n=1 Tax=Limosa lapponica baueri TaxID=1758121 RepID=A0A2I0U0K3_LIMLA|nr:hypothetical protein llap_10146 [Limosa lapponica baueri]